MTGDCVGMFISLEPISPGKIAVVDPIESRRVRHAEPPVAGPEPQFAERGVAAARRGFADKKQEVPPRDSRQGSAH